jgi:hypothetical protein
LSILLHGTFLILLFLMIFWAINAVQSLHDKLDQIPGTDSGVSLIIQTLKEHRSSVHDEIEACRWQMDPLHQTVEGVQDRLYLLLRQYDNLLEIALKLEKNTPARVDSPDARNR